MNTQPESNLVKMTGIILPGEKNPLVENIAEELHRLGLYRYERDSFGIMTNDLCNSLNNYRRANSLPELGYADPVTLRLLLGEDFGGDELVLLADNAEGEPDELAKFEFCRRMLSLSRETGAPLTVLLLSSDRKPKPHASAGTMRSAILAWILDNAQQ